MKSAFFGRIARTSATAMVALVLGSGAMLVLAQGQERQGQTAERIVNQTAGVAKGEVVQIDGTPRDLPVLESLATEVRKRGAFPLVTIRTDRMLKESYTEVPAEFDRQEPKLDLALADLIDVLILVGDLDSPDLLADVPNLAERRNLRSKGTELVFQRMTKNNVRFVELNNGLYPAEWRAQRVGMKVDELARLFWQAINVDYSALQARGRAIAQRFRNAKQVRITADGGTDLTVQIAGRPVLISDGIISSEDRKRGGTATWAYLPAGEVYVTPVAGTARGKVVIPLMHYDGREVRNLALTFRDGKLTQMQGSGAGYAGLKAVYDAQQDARKSEFAAVDVGINQELKVPKDRGLGAWAPAGTVTIGIGGNVWAGGDNESAYGLYGQLVDATVTLDGKPIVEKGRLNTT